MAFMNTYTVRIWSRNQTYTDASSPTATGCAEIRIIFETVYVLYTYVLEFFVLKIFFCLGVGYPL